MTLARVWRRTLAREARSGDGHEGTHQLPEAETRPSRSEAADWLGETLGVLGEGLYTTRTKVKLRHLAEIVPTIHGSPERSKPQSLSGS